MIKLLVSDLDHTLLNDDKTVDADVRQAVRNMIETGVDVAIASGRVDSEIKQVGDRFLDHACHRVSENGVYVLTADGEQLYETILPPEWIQPITDLTHKYDFLSVFNIHKQSFVMTKTADVRQYEETNEVAIHEDANILDRLSPSFPLTKIAIIGEISKLKQFEQELAQHFTGKVNFYLSSPNCVDVVPLGASKGLGVQKLIAELGIKPDEVACVGDSYNDLSMFNITPHSFAMTHAEKQVRETAQHTVDSVAEVVAYILQHNGASITK